MGWHFVTGEHKHTQTHIYTLFTPRGKLSPLIHLRHVPGRLEDTGEPWGNPTGVTWTYPSNVQRSVTKYYVNHLNFRFELISTITQNLPLWISTSPSMRRERRSSFFVASACEKYRKEGHCVKTCFWSHSLQSLGSQTDQSRWLKSSVTLL